MMLLTVSDLHLMDHYQPFLFNARKEKVFVALCEVLLRNGGKMLFNGDIFDLTGLTPCDQGQREFFEVAVPSALWDVQMMEGASRRRSTEELLRAIAAAYPAFFASLATLAQSGQLLYIPGNHDCAFLKPEGREAFARVLGVPTTQWLDYYQTPDLLVAHGNQFDRSNQTAQGCRNPGLVFTSALYRAVLPALRMLGVDETVLDAIPAVRPEEETVIGLEDHLGEERARQLLVAFAQLLQRNGYFRGFSRVPAWFLSHDFPLVSQALRQGVTPERVRGILPNEDRLIEQARIGARRLRELHPGSRTVILGHTHEFDPCVDYVNLGTWIDHLKGLKKAQIENPEMALPVFVQTDRQYVVDAQNFTLGRDLRECPLLWSRL